MKIWWRQTRLTNNFGSRVAIKIFLVLNAYVEREWFKFCNLPTPPVSFCGMFKGHRADLLLFSLKFEWQKKQCWWLANWWKKIHFFDKNQLVCWCWFWPVIPRVLRRLSSFRWTELCLENTQSGSWWFALMCFGMCPGLKTFDNTPQVGLSLPTTWFLGQTNPALTGRFE